MRSATEFYTTAEMSGLFFLVRGMQKSVKICDLLSNRQNGTTAKIRILTGKGLLDGTKL